MTGSSRTLVVGLATAVAVLCIAGASLTSADGLGADASAEAAPALKLKASVNGLSAPVAPMTIELFRWSTDVERAPLLTALTAPPPAPPSAPAAAAVGRGGRAARGGRGAAAPPPSPIARLATAIKAAPTVGFIWSDGPTGYSIKYAWRSASPNLPERVVLVTDRRLGAHATGWPASTSDLEFTVVEMRIDGKGIGEAKSSLTSAVVVDAAANTLAIDKYADAPVLLKVTR